MRKHQAGERENVTGARRALARAATRSGGEQRRARDPRVVTGKGKKKEEEKKKKTKKRDTLA